MKISVIIPALNEEEYIEPTLFHIKRQKPYETIVADSGSGDRTRGIARRCGAKVVDAKKGSASTGRNAGGRAASGDILLFLDADTLAFPNLLDDVRKKFSSKKVAGYTCNIYGYSPNFREQLVYKAFNDIVKMLIRMKKPHAAGVVIAVRKDVFEKTGGFNEKLRVAEDHDFAMRAGKCGEFVFSPDTCVFTSTRRLKKWGISGFVKRYSKAYLKFIYDKEGKNSYNPVR